MNDDILYNEPLDQLGYDELEELMHPDISGGNYIKIKSKNSPVTLKYKVHIDDIFDDITVKELILDHNLAIILDKVLYSEDCKTLAEYMKKNPKKASSIMKILAKQKPLLNKVGFEYVSEYYYLNIEIVKLIQA